jgi:hypothetical protein
MDVRRNLKNISDLPENNKDKKKGGKGKSTLATSSRTKVEPFSFMHEENGCHNVILKRDICNMTNLYLNDYIQTTVTGIK